MPTADTLQSRNDHAVEVALRHYAGRASVIGSEQLHALLLHVLPSSRHHLLRPSTVDIRDEETGIRLCRCPVPAVSTGAVNLVATFEPHEELSTDDLKRLWDAGELKLVKVNGHRGTQFTGLYLGQVRLAAEVDPAGRYVQVLVDLTDDTVELHTAAAYVDAHKKRIQLQG